jgi:hypothetical protein
VGAQLNVERAWGGVFAANEAQAMYVADPVQPAPGSQPQPPQPVFPAVAPQLRPLPHHETHAVISRARGNCGVQPSTGAAAAYISARLSSSQSAHHRAVELPLPSSSSAFYISVTFPLLISVPSAPLCTSHSGWNPGEYKPAHPGSLPRRVCSGLRPAPTQPLVS